MTVPAVLKQQYDYYQPYIKMAGTLVKDIVSGYAERYGYAFVGRPKSLESLAEKIETGRFSKWSELDDLYACTIVTPTLNSETAVLDFLKSKFNIVDVKLRGSTNKDPAIFRYDSTRFVGTLKASDFPSQNRLVLDIKFEVQIRSALEHAWSVATHALSYKDTQVDWKRVRLSAQLKASVEQLDMLILGFNQTSENITQSAWFEIDFQKSIYEAFKGQIADGNIPTSAEPASWMRFCQNVYSAIIRSNRYPTRREEQQSIVNNTQSALREAFADLTSVPYPESLSLFQYAVAILSKADIIKEQRRAWLPITSELLALYPHTSKIGQMFDFEAQTISNPPTRSPEAMSANDGPAEVGA